MSSNKANELLVDSVHLEFGRQTVLQSAYISSKTGHVTGVLGRNGSGKSSLFKCIMGGVRAQNRFVRFNDEVDTDYAHIGNRVRYLPQNRFIPSSMTLAEAFKLYGADYEKMVNFDSKFTGYRDIQAGELSGGEVRLAEIGLVLYSECEFCILDEPFSYIAPVYVERIKNLIMERKQEMGIIVSDHQYETIMEISDELFLLKDGYSFPVKTTEDLIRYGYISSFSQVNKRLMDLSFASPFPV